MKAECPERGAAVPVMALRHHTASATLDRDVAPAQQRRVKQAVIIARAYPCSSHPVRHDFPDHRCRCQLAMASPGTRHYSFTAPVMPDT